jgi:hypothetical protein
MSEQKCPMCEQNKASVVEGIDKGYVVWWIWCDNCAFSSPCYRSKNDLYRAYNLVEENEIFMDKSEAKKLLFKRLNAEKEKHDKALDVYGTQAMYEAISAVEEYFATLDKINNQDINKTELFDLVNKAETATFDIPEVAVPFTAVMNPEIVKAYSDGNLQGYQQGFKDGKKKGSVMHADGTVSFESYTPDEVLELAVKEALQDNYDNIPNLSKQENYNLGIYALREWYNELK